MSDALGVTSQHDRLRALLADMDAESGPVPDDLLEEARQLWRGPDKTSGRSRQ